MLKNIIFILICSFVSITGFAQTDTVFWFSAPDVSSGLGDSPVYVRLMTYANSANVTLSVPANGLFTPIVRSIPANSIDSINLTSFLASIENASADAILNNGIKISSTQNISAFYELHANSNKEFISLKGRKALGTDFYTPFPYNWANGNTTPASFSSIEIVATQNGTVVLISPKTPVTTAHAANVSYTVTLNAGQTYSAQDQNLSAVTSLAGSIISSNKPIAVTVFSGAVDESGTLSTMMDQLTNSSYAGNSFVIRKGKASNERIYILATQNNTSVDIYGVSTSNSLINVSETKEYILTDSVTYIKTTQPVYVWHASGFGNKLCGAQVPTLFCAGANSTAVTRTSSDSFALVLYTRAGYQNQFSVNGNPSLIPAAAFAVVPGTAGNIVCAQIFYSTASIPVNTPVMVTNTGDVFGLGVLQGSSVRGSSYAYFSEFKSTPFVNAGLNLTTCANSPINIAGSVGGGNIDGLWSGTGFGLFQSALTTLNNTYIPSNLDTTNNPIKLILSSTGLCGIQKDTLLLTVTPAPIVIVSSNLTTCGNVGSIALNGSITGGANTGVWTANGSGVFIGGTTNLQSSYQFSSSDTLTGAVRFILTSTNNGMCNAASDTMFVTITHAPRVDAGPPSVVVCANNPTVLLNGIISGVTTAGKWTTSGTGIFTPNNSSLTTTFQPSTNDVLGVQTMLYLTSTNNGTCLPVKDSVEIIFTPAPIVNAGLDTYACFNNTKIQLAGLVSGAATTGYWMGGTGMFSPDSSKFNAIYTPTAAEVASGSISLTLVSTNNGSCNAVTSNVKIDFVLPPMADFTSIDVCNGTATDFVNASTQSYGPIIKWLYQFGDGAVDSLTASTNHTYAVAGTYSASLIVTSSVGCSDTLTKPVTVLANPVANFVDTLSCAGTGVVANLYDQSTVITPETIDSWFWDFGNMGTNPSQNPTLPFSIAGTYQIKLLVKSSNGCSNLITKSIVVPRAPHAAFFYSSTSGFNIGATISFTDSSSNAITHLWDFNDNNSTSTYLNPEHTYYQNGTYHVTYIVSNTIGCVDTAKATIVITNITDEITTLIPNAISPNNDGKNDVWKLPFLDFKYPNTTVEIYNRWGQKVFASEGYKTPWDGTFNGEALPMGNYYYILNLNDPDKPEVYKGAILLLR